MVKLKSLITPPCWGILPLLLVFATFFLQSDAKVIQTRNQNLIPTGGSVDLLNNLVEWWDFATGSSTSDLAGNVNPSWVLTENGGSCGGGTYTSSGGVNFYDANSTDLCYLLENTVDDNWLVNSTDTATWAIRFKANTGVSDNHWAFRMKAGRVGVQIGTSSNMLYEAGGILLDTGELISTEQWYVAVGMYKYDSGTSYVYGWLDGSATSTPSTTGTPNFVSTGAVTFPNNNQWNFDFDWFGCWNRELTTDEITALVNGGSTLEYTDLSGL